MQRKRIRTARLCAALLLATGLVARESGGTHATDLARRSYGPGDLKKMISVVKTKKPPVIDGIINEGEWDDAAGITGLIKAGWVGQPGVQGNTEESSRTQMGNMANDQSFFWITYDDEYLYVAHLSPPPANIKDNPAIIQVMLKKNQTLHDSNIDWDDSIDIEIMAPVHPGGDNYIIQINSIGTVFDCIWGGEQGNLPGITVGWESGAISKSTLTLDGWVVETAIPWEHLGPHIQKPAPGDVKYMNFGRMWREIIEESHAWSVYDGFRPKGEVLFAGDKGIVVQVEDTGNLPRGQAVFAARLKNLCATEKKLIAEVATDSGELQDKQELALKPGATAPYRFEGQIADRATTTIAFTVTDAASGEVLHVTTLPVIRPTKPDIFVRRYRSQELMKFEIDLAFIGAANLKKTSVALEVRAPGTKRRVFSRTYKGFASHQPVLEFSTKGWLPGDYDARVVVRAPGLKPYETVVGCAYPPLPEWWYHRCGWDDMDHDMVPYPWTDIALTNDTIRVWGRDYGFGQRLLPATITTLDYPILRAPMRLIVKTADGATLDTASIESKVEWTKTNRTRVESVRALQSGSLAVRNAVWAEYDGLVWNTLRVTPRGKVAVASMELEIPLTREFTDVINPMDYSLRTTGKLKPEGYRGPPTRPIWLGNGDGGLQWLNGADNTFHVQDPRQVIRVESGEEGATLRIVMIDTPTALDAPYEVQFGVIATPVRPKLTRTAYFRERSVVGGGPWFPQGMDFMACPDPGVDYYSGGIGGRIYAHTTPINVSPDAMKLDALGENDYLFADEFRANAADRSFMVVTDHRTQAARDYYVWRHWRYQKKYRFAGIYYDSPSGVMLGLREVMKRLYNVTLMNHHFAARDMAIGLHCSAMFDMSAGGFASYNWDGENYNSIINETQPTYRGAIDPARFRAQHMGHNFGWPIMFLGQGRLKPAWVTANGGPEAVIDQLQGLELLHDSRPSGWHIAGPMDQVCQRASETGQRLQLNHWIYQFTPYWHQDIVKLPDANMHASFYIARPSQLAATNPNDHMGYPHGQRAVTFVHYFEDRLPQYACLPGYISAMNFQETEAARPEFTRMRDRVVMVLYNNTAWEGVMRVKPDWQKLGLGSPDSLTASNAVHSTGFRLEKVKNDKGEEVEKGVFFPRPEEYARIEGEELVFPMTKWNYRMIVLEKKP